MLHQHSTLNCKGKLIDLSEPIVMGILNVTPDSFFDGGKFLIEKNILAQVNKMIEDGATIIDVGGMSSRPGAELIDVEEELSRVIPVIEMIHSNFSEAIISIDTVCAEVAEKSILAGASIINDISAGNIDGQMFETVAKLKVPYILMHMQGTPETMQQNPDYEELMTDVLDFFIEKIGKLRALNVKDILLDVGFGFGKSIKDNYHLLENLEAFKILGLPLLVGISRKSMIYKLLDTDAKNALNGTTVLNTLALERGAKVLRVHDVREAVETIQLWKQLKHES